MRTSLCVCVCVHVCVCVCVCVCVSGHAPLEWTRGMGNFGYHCFFVFFFFFLLPGVRSRSLHSISEPEAAVRTLSKVSFLLRSSRLVSVRRCRHELQGLSPVLVFCCCAHDLSCFLQAFGNLQCAVETGTGLDGQCGIVTLPSSTRRRATDWPDCCSDHANRQPTRFLSHAASAQAGSFGCLQLVHLSGGLDSARSYGSVLHSTGSCMWGASLVFFQPHSAAKVRN